MQRRTAKHDPRPREVGSNRNTTACQMTHDDVALAHAIIVCATSFSSSGRKYDFTDMFVTQVLNKLEYAFKYSAPWGGPVFDL